MATINDLMQFNNNLSLKNILVQYYTVERQANYNIQNYRSGLYLIIFLIVIACLGGAVIFTTNGCFTIPIFIGIGLFRFKIGIDAKFFVDINTPIIKQYYPEYISSEFNETTLYGKKYKLINEYIDKIRRDLFLDFCKENQISQDFQSMNDLKTRFISQIKRNIIWTDKYKWAIKWLLNAPALIISAWFGVFAATVKTDTDFKLYNGYLMGVLILFIIAGIIVEPQVREYMNMYQMRNNKYKIILDTLDTVIAESPIGK